MTPEEKHQICVWGNDIKSRFWKGEQYLIGEPGNPYSGVDRLHSDRYELARDIIKERGYKTVLDCAAGCAYGGIIMKPEKYVGIDIEGYVVDYAHKFCLPWIGENAECIQHDIETPLPFETGSFDMVVSFETLEHVPKDGALTFIHEVFRVLRLGGTWIVSSPLAQDEKLQLNSFHDYEWDYTELLKELEHTGFKVEATYEASAEKPSLDKIPDIYHHNKEKSHTGMVYYCVYQCVKP